MQIETANLAESVGRTSLTLWMWREECNRTRAGGSGCGATESRTGGPGRKRRRYHFGPPELEMVVSDFSHFLGGLL